MRRNLGNIVFVFLVGLNLIVWLVFPPVNDGREDFIRTYAGEVLGSTVIILMSFSLFISTRPKWAEPYFGGLDKMYKTHRRTSITAFSLLLVHVLTVSITNVFDWQLGNYLAVIAFTGVVSIVLITLAPNGLAAESYNGWKKLHRFIGVFFIVGFIHALTVDTLDALIAITWVQMFFILGTGSYLYTELFGRFFGKYVPYVVKAVRHPNPVTTEVTLEAKRTPIKPHRAGQFLFVRFPGSKELNESHPFTISSAPTEGALRVTIKISGDFTQTLFDQLEPGMDAVVEGAYGLFDYKRGLKKQIWLAGGIGLTPFMSFIRDFGDSLDFQIDFFYAVRQPEDALFLDEIHSAAAAFSNFRAHVHYSAEAGSLSIDEILAATGADFSEYSIYLCGPVGMIEDFSSEFRSSGVPRSQIHYEEFRLR